MNLFNPYLALAIYPLLVYCLGDPAAYSWGWNQGAEPMPPTLASRVERNGRFAWIVRYAILLTYVLYGMRVVTFRRGTPIQSAVFGVVLGVVLWMVRWFVLPRWLGISLENPDHSMTRGPVGIWAIIIVIGGFSEELWRALAIYFLRHDGLSALEAILLTSVAFAVAQLGGRPSRISGRRYEVYFTVFVGICLGKMLVTFHSLTLVVFANIVYHSLVFYFMRRTTKLTIAEPKAWVLQSTPG